MGVFGSIQGTGKTSKFSSRSKQERPFRPDVTNAQLETPPAPMAYSGIKLGPEFAIEYEPNEAPPIDGSASWLRTLSPFMIQVEPPLAYVAASDTSKKDYAGILEAGHGAAPSAYRAARNAIEVNLPGGGLVSGMKSVEQFVANGVVNKPSGADGLDTKDLKGDGAGRIGTPAIADVYTAVDITMQLRALLQTPPLILLVNPQTLTLNYNKVQQFTDRTRHGYVFQAWGEEQPKLSIEAKCGAFISGGRGVQWASRRDSAAWQNMATAFHFYKNNGYIHDTIGKSNAHHFVGALSIHYDGWVYYGNMESLNYAFDEATQHGGVTFSMEFTVNAMVDTTKSALVVTPMMSPVPSPSDPRYAGFDNRASSSSVGFTVGPNGGLQQGSVDFYTINAANRGLSTSGPSGTKGTQSGPGLLTAPPNERGFVSPTPAAVTSASSSGGRLVPFRLR